MHRNIFARGNLCRRASPGSGLQDMSRHSCRTVLMPGRGFSLTVVPRNGRPARHFEVGGKGLALLWAGGAVVLILAAAAIVMLFTGSPIDPAASGSAARIAELEDSLDMMTDMSVRMDSLEAGLVELCEARERLERIAGFAGPLPGDTL